MHLINVFTVSGMIHFLFFILNLINITIKNYELIFFLDILIENFFLYIYIKKIIESVRNSMELRYISQNLETSII